MRAAAERSGGFLGGTTHLWRLSGQGSVYQALWRRLIGALNARAGIVHETGPSSEVPVFERFFIGGSNSVRGYRERGAGPKDLLGGFLGGKLVMGGGGELRFPLYRRLHAASFAEGGQVGQKLTFVQPSRWKYGAGGGLRLLTPVVPFRADLGYKLNPDPGDAALWRVHLSLGKAF